MTLPRYHPGAQQNDLAATPASPVQSPAASSHRVAQPIHLESPRLMREKQRELLEQARLSSKLAASPLGLKPGSPRLDPLGSPKGPVTPLALEQAGDYFQIARASKGSTAGSPGARSSRSDRSESSLSGKEDKVKKSRKTDVYQ